MGLCMKKFNQLCDKIINEWKLVTSDEHKKHFEEAKKIFDKEGPKLINKINDYFKRQGLQCYFTLESQVFFSDGYRRKVKFHAEGDKKGREWYQWVWDVDGYQTTNLIYKTDGYNSIALKDTWRKMSHRGEVVNFDAIGRNGF